MPVNDTVYLATSPLTTDASLTTSDVTTNNVTSTKHGFAPKSPADATKFLNGGATPAWSVPHGELVNVRVLTLTTAQTYTPTAGTVSIVVECWGGGGGGGGTASSLGASGGGGGGASGAYCRKYYSSIGATYSYQCGAKGAGGTVGNNPGTVGSDTTFDTMTAKGGGGGGGCAATGGAAGGIPVVATGGDVNWAGEPGTIGLGPLGAIGVSGSGGGLGGGAGLSTVGTGLNGAGPGAGGGGGCQVNNGGTRAGGDGADGTILVWEFS